MLHRKPPLPKQPPRVISVCAKKCADANSQKGVAGEQQQQQRKDNNNNSNQGARVATNYHNQSVSSGGDDVDQSAYRFASHNPRLINGGTMEGGSGVAAVSGSKIGLIETNLDTHETSISGKTRSLMELHPQGPQRMRYSQPGRSGGGGGGGQRLSGVVDGRQSLGPEGRSSINGPTVADVIRQRPHKSMEFLLDKENQLYTLVSR